MKKLDIVIILSILFVGLTAFAVNMLLNANDKGDARVEIYIESKLYKTLPLTDAQQTIEVQSSNGSNTVLVSKDGVKMTHSDCSSQTCVNTPKQTVSGGVIACLPAT